MDTCKTYQNCLVATREQVFPPLIAQKSEVDVSETSNDPLSPHAQTQKARPEASKKVPVRVNGEQF